MENQLAMFDIEPIPTRDHVPGTQVHAVFEHWMDVHRRRQCLLTDKRRRRIIRAIRDYGYDTVIDAIDGCARSDWHMGANPTGKTYNDILLILRDAEHIEHFAALAQPPSDAKILHPAAAAFLRGRTA
jgi:hypothetical protein